MKPKAITGIVLTFLLMTATLTLISTNMPSLVRSHLVQTLGGGSTEVCGYISVNTTWTLTSSPYIVTCDVIVEPGAFLTIEPEVVVKFTTGKNLVIYGGLIAQGNATHKITFTSNTTTPSQGDWGSVRFKGTHFLMNHALVEYATKGIELINVANIENSIISNCTTGVEGDLSHANNLTVIDSTSDGLSLSSSLHIENSDIVNNGRHGITITATINMDDCIVSNNTEDGVILSNGGDIQNSLITDNGGNGTRILGSTTILNTTISDNGGDGLWAESDISIVECTITGNGKNGIKDGYVDGSMTIQNSNISYNSGDGIWTNSSVEITTCNITYNVGNGAIAANDCTMDVYLSNIRNNTLSGLSGSGYVSNSTVAGNKMGGVLGNFTIEVFSSITWNQGGGFNGTGSIDWSSICDNKPYDAVADIWPNNITATNNWWGTDNGNLIEEHIWHHNDAENLGYVLYDPWLNMSPPLIDRIPPEISEPVCEGTSPYPYLNRTGLDDDLPLDFPIRLNEPVHVSVNVTDNESPKPSGVNKVFLSYRVVINQSVGEWWNTTMTLTNETTGNWAIIIPAHQVPDRYTNVSISFFIQAYDKDGNPARSPEAEEDYYSYTIKWLPVGDVSGDGKVRVDDVLRVALQFGQ